VYSTGSAEMYMHKVFKGQSCISLRVWDLHPYIQILSEVGNNYWGEREWAPF